MKETYVVFIKNSEGARILVNPTKELLNNHKNAGAIVLKDPQRVNLVGVPPHLWLPNVELNQVYSASKNEKTPIQHIHAVKKKIDMHLILICVSASAIVSGLIELIKHFAK